MVMTNNPRFTTPATTPYGIFVLLNMDCLIKSIISVALSTHIIMCTSNSTESTRDGTKAGSPCIFFWDDMISSYQRYWLRNMSGWMPLTKDSLVWYQSARGLMKGINLSGRCCHAFRKLTIGLFLLSIFPR